MGTYMVLGILAVIIAAALASGVRHFKGQGGCCGGGGDVKLDEEQKVLEHPVIARKKFTVEGMTCAACKSRIERRVNQIEGASCRVDLKNKLAVIELDREVPEGLLVGAVQALDYKVVKTETEEL